MNPIRTISIVMAVLTGILIVPNPGNADDFTNHLRAHASESPGLEHLAAALDQFDLSAAMLVRSELDEIVHNGWSGAHREVLAVLQSQSPALGSAVTAAMTPNLRLPPVQALDPDLPVPSILYLQAIWDLIAADAWRQLAEGNVSGATQRAIEHHRFVQIFHASSQQPLVVPLFSLRGLNDNLTLLGEILRHPALTPEDARRIGAELYTADFDTDRLAENLLMEVPRNSAELRMIVQTQLQIPHIRERLQQTDPQTFTAFQAYLRDNAANPEEQDRQIAVARQRLQEELSKPFPELGVPLQLEPILEQSVPEDQLRNVLLQTLPSPGQYYLHAGHVLARMRATTALSALRIGQEDFARQIIDPYTGNPLVITEGAIYSLGPDGEDQGGQVEFDPAAGPEAPGDIVVRR